MKVYLAAPFYERARMRAVRDMILRPLGIICSARWIDLPDSVDDHVADAEFARARALEDAADIEHSDWFVTFTEAPSTHAAREVEFGIAMALGKRLVIVGEPLNLFHLCAVIVPNLAALQGLLIGDAG